MCAACPIRHVAASAHATTTRLVLSRIRLNLSSRLLSAASVADTLDTATPQASLTDVGKPRSVTALASFSPTALTAVTTLSSKFVKVSARVSPSSVAGTSTPILTSADSFARLTEADTTEPSASRVLRTFAAQPPQCIPRTSSMTTSSSHRTFTSPPR